jgi:Immunoglobulin domain
VPSELEPDDNASWHRRRRRYFNFSHSRNHFPHLKKQINVFSLVPPVIVDAGSSASHITVREGLSLTLTCRGDGVPAPKVTWRREDGRPIFLGDKKKEGG